MAMAGDARIAPAVALPQHIRSHFQAQDLPESGGDALYAVSTGWLNSALAFASGLQTELEAAALLSGATPAASPDSPAPPASPEMVTAKGRADSRDFALAATKFLRVPGGPSVAVLSLDGFDTHVAQGAVDGQLAVRLANLDGVLERLKEGLGPEWSRTVVVAVTQFGRTAHVNGTRGTDHGTASTLILAGGALKRGGIVGDWPGLSQAKLFEGRDLPPTLDVRQVFKGVLADHLDLTRRALDEQVFPGNAGAPALTGLITA